jgi:hypothetical protein
MARAHSPAGSQPPLVELTVHQGPQPGQRFSLTRPTIIIGRTAGNDVVVNDPEVSRRHASLTWDGRQHIIQDLGSANGTFVNGARLTAPQMLQQGDVIGLGPRVLLAFQATLPVVSPARPEPDFGELSQAVEGPPVAKRPGKRRVVLPLLAALLGLGCLVLTVAGVAVWFYYDSQRRQVINDRPLVLIQAPLNREQIPLGEGVLAHATARAESGVARVELWADGAFIAARENPGEGPTSPLVLSAGWEPTTLGRHTLLVRAISAQGVKGQATVAVEVVEAVEPETVLGAHIVQEGETLESIAEDVDVDVEELEDLNPDLSPDGAQPGDLVLYSEEPVPGGAEGPAGGAPPSGAEPPPAGEPPGGAGEPPGGGAPPSGGEPPPADEPPPVPHDEAPGSFLYVMEIIGLEGLIPADPTAGEPVGLRAEVLALETDGAYESLHCYVDLGGGDPRWYPDEDLDQSTYESFASLGGGSWDVAAHLSGEAVPVISWPDDQPLPISITCVGIIEGGTDPAVELGWLELNVPPGAWGIIQHDESEGGEGTFTLDYRVSRVELLPIGPQTWIDYDMTRPTNLRIMSWTDQFGNPAGQSLYWAYEPEEDEGPIDGFRVYLNDTLQWVEPPRARTSDLPSQWFHPPCGDEYRFTVSAFRYGFPDGPESPPSDPLTFTSEPGDPGCEQAYLVTFNTLTTGLLPEDDIYSGMHGSFYVNDQRVGFDGRCCGINEMGYEVRLHSDDEYDISGLTTEIGDGPARFIVTPQSDDETLVVGYDIWAWYGASFGDTQMCSWERSANWRDLAPFLEPVYESTLGSLGPVQGWCHVSYTIEPAPGRPVVEPGAPPPLPLLRVANLTVDDTGWLQIHVLNEGTADWTRPLTFAVERRSGERVGVYTWPTLLLSPGQRTIVEYDMSADPQPGNVCVVLDPDNEVPELDDRRSAPRDRYCPPLPDLTISGVEYDPEGERLLVQVQSRYASVEHGDVSLLVTLPDGGTLSDRPVLLSDVTLVGYTRLELSGIGEEQRARMMGGYTVAVDPLGLIEETNDDNNEYVVPAGARLRLRWRQITTYYYPYGQYSDNPQEQTHNMQVRLGPFQGYYSPPTLPGRTTVAEFTHGPFEVVGTVQGGPWEGMGTNTTVWPTDQVVEFEIAGDETLYVIVDAAMKYRWHDEESLGSGATAFTPGHWGVGQTISEDEDCAGLGDIYIDQQIAVQPLSPWSSCPDWHVYFVICRVE